MKKLILTAMLAISLMTACKKDESTKQECSTITGEGFDVLDKAGAIQRWFSVSNGKKIKTYINTKDAYHVGGEICYRPDEVYKN